MTNYSFTRNSRQRAHFCTSLYTVLHNIENGHSSFAEHKTYESFSVLVPNSLTFILTWGVLRCLDLTTRPGATLRGGGRDRRGEFWVPFPPKWDQFEEEGSRHEKSSPPKIKEICRRKSSIFEGSLERSKDAHMAFGSFVGTNAYYSGKYGYLHYFGHSKFDAKNPSDANINRIFVSS